MEQQDWQVNRTQHECAKYMLENQLNTDVNFRVGENQWIIQANKLILSMRSPVFDRMFNGKFSEAAEDPVIPDISPDAFHIVLRYCYYDCLEVPYEMAVSTLYTAKKYILPILENHARAVLIQKLCVSNIWDIFEHSVDIGDEKLQIGCKNYFSDNVATVREALSVSNFLTISHNALLAFLHMNDMSENTDPKPAASENHTLGICISEVELFKACNAWAEAECLRQEIDPTGANKRTVLGECLFLMRLPTMLYEDLVNEVYPAGILIQTEKDNLCQYKHKKPDSNCQLEFPTTEKQFLTGFVDKLDENHCSGNSTFCVESKERVLLSKLWIISSCQPQTVTVKDETSDRSLSIKLPSAQPQVYVIEGVDCKLKCVHIEPMVLNAGAKYSVTVTATTGRKQNPGPDDPSLGPFTLIKQISISRSPGYTYLKALTCSLV